MYLSVNPTYIRLLTLLLRGGRVDTDGLLRDAGLNWQQLVHSSQPVDLRDVEHLVTRAVSVTGRPWLGIELGSRTDPSSHGSVGYAIATSRDLRQGLEVFVRYAELRSNALKWRIDPTVGGIRITAAESQPLGALREFIHDTVFALTLRIIEGFVAGPPERVRVTLPFSAPHWASRYERCGPRLVRFDNPVLTFEVPDALLSMPSMTADAEAHEVACRECERASAGLSRLSFSDQVREMLERATDGAYPELLCIAKFLGTSPRTVRRRLNEEGTSYQTLLDDARKERALWYLNNTKQTVEVIAARLGYVDTSNFSRTFRRWFGTTPGALRARSDARVRGSWSSSSESVFAP